MSNNASLPRARAKSKGNKIEIFVGRHFVGKVLDDVFTKSVRGSEHFLRQPQAIAFSVAALELARKKGANYLEVVDQEAGFSYTVSIAHFLHYAFDVQRGGYEPQKALVLERWDVHVVDWVELDGERYKLPQFVQVAQPEQTVTQLSLF